MLQKIYSVRTLLVLVTAATLSLEAASQMYSQRLTRDEFYYRPTNVRADVDSDVYSYSTTRGGFNAYQGRRGMRNTQSRFFDIRRDVVRPPTAAQRYRAAKERHVDRIDYDYGTQIYPSDHYALERMEQYEAPTRASGIPRLGTVNYDYEPRGRMLTGVNRTRSDRVPDYLKNDVAREREALEESLADTTIVEFKAVDGETVLTNEPEKYRGNPVYVEVVNHSRKAESSTSDARREPSQNG